MNAADDKENTDTNGAGCSGMSNGSSSSNGVVVGVGVGEHNSCSRQMQQSTSSVCNGARPKTQSLMCNIPNGLSQHNYTVKLNVNNMSGGGGAEGEKVHNGNGMDVYMRNNVDYCIPVDKCPPKVRKHVTEKSDSDLRGLCKKDEDSMSENEEEDEYCIYTYKGDQNQMADLPSSFFRLGVAPTGRENHEARSSSPDMDYLEMDFDPGPSNGGDDSSDDSDCCDMQHEEDRPTDESDDGQGEEMQRRSVSPTVECGEVAFEENHENVNSNEVSVNGSEQLGWNLQNFKLRRVEDNRAEEVICNGSNDSNDGTKEVNNASSCSSSASSSSSIRGVPVGEPKNDLSGNTKCNSTLCGASTSTSAPQQVAHASSSVFYRSPSASRELWGYHYSSGDLCSPGDPATNNLEGWCEKANDYMKVQGEHMDTRKYNLRSALYHCIMAKRLVLDKQASFSDGDHSNLDDKEDESPDSNRPIERVMIWSEQEACVKQVTQIGTSQCGATAVINVMEAFNVPYTMENVTDGVATKFRSENAPVAEYLFSRCLAGATHEDIIRGLDCASQGTMKGKFFHMYPERDICLTSWLASWMKKGAIPIATINLQRGVNPDGPIPDVWHHQMIFGVGARGIYVTNPLECIPEKVLMTQLCSPSILKIRRADLLSRWTPTTDLRLLTKHPDIRWKRMNVLGQVANVIREAQWSRQGLCTRNTCHISIPASYCSGITLVMCTDNPAYEQLMSSPELPTIGT